MTLRTRRNIVAVLVVVFVCVFLGFMGTKAMAASEPAEFSWEANTETDLAGYKIHYGSAPGVYTEIVDCGLPVTNTEGRVEFTIESPPDGNTYYVATAYDSAGQESAYSNEVSNDGLPAAPGSLIYKTTTTTTTTTTISINPAVAVN